jgi:hypothetical protein
LRICEKWPPLRSPEEKHSLSLSCLSVSKKKHARQAGKCSGTQPTSQRVSSVRTCLPTFRLPAVLSCVGTFNLQPAALKNAARDCGNARESLQTLLQHFVMECFVAEGEREGRSEAEEKRREQRYSSSSSARSSFLSTIPQEVCSNCSSSIIATKPTTKDKHPLLHNR